MKRLKEHLSQSKSHHFSKEEVASLTANLPVPKFVCSFSFPDGTKCSRTFERSDRRASHLKLHDVHSSTAQEELLPETQNLACPSFSAPPSSPSPPDYEHYEDEESNKQVPDGCPATGDHSKVAGCDSDLKGGKRRSSGHSADSSIGRSRIEWTDRFDLQDDDSFSRRLHEYFFETGTRPSMISSSTSKDGNVLD
eukprot:CAMPEP_0184348888 /NCGR_PEP_ID=MMETSP1089-20130417/32020_1 /TAXON_ID=38269 ORGANISM="Gloeochaete wittrockiana, Strain SAG46.84" /NCGR_SAMPLE_ID=MMETSP1089 /ASSEMBLY_ACC=CAM_ASM_000445 /LENGTH=194 /DNA_ID=CAMNT_0026680869 /DNA_START=198 /DNA_END=779 /DNA_ORIENTATION=+